MPRAAKVSESDAIETIILFKEDLQNGVIPAYSHNFYQKVSEKLNNNWSAQNVYTHLRENRRNLRTKVFEKLGIKEDENLYKTPSLVNAHTESIFLDYNDEEPPEWNELEYLSGYKNNNDVSFDLIINPKSWAQMKPVTCNYSNRNYLVLKPGVWTDIVAEEFWLMYRIPCAYSFKKHYVSLNPGRPFLYIQGECKSKKCKNEFHAVAMTEPRDGEELLLDVKTKDTRTCNHEPVNRQLKNKKRQVIVEQLLKEGAANCRRNIASKVQNLGNVPSPILYKSEVLRKLLQEAIEKELGIDSKDGNHPVLILQKLKYRSPYIGSIQVIGLDPFYLQYHLREQTIIYKEYCRLFRNHVTVCIDSTSSLAKPVTSEENVKSGNIFLFEIVINLFGITVAVGQFLTASQDTNHILFGINNWLLEVGKIPPESVSDYSRPLMAAESLAFNGLSVKDYIKACFFALTNPENKNRPANTYIRIDVAHFIAIFCRLKCFNSTNKPVKDFLIRCIALLVSCDDFTRFEDILLQTLIITCHSYNGTMVGSFLPSQAQKAREKLISFIESEKHNAMLLIPEENSEEFKKTVSKLSVNGLDPQDDNFLNEETDSDVTIDKWLADIKRKAENEKDTKTVSEQVNPYRLEKFFNHLLSKAKEFILWSSVMRKLFLSPYVRPTSCFVEGDFGELKTNVIHKRVHGPLRPDKLFRFHFEALRGQCLIASSAIAQRLMKSYPVNDEKKNSLKQIDISVNSDSQCSAISFIQSLSENQNPIPLHSSSMNEEKQLIPVSERTYVISDQPECALLDVDFDLSEKEIWRDKGAIEEVLFHESLIAVDADLHLKENWRKKGEKETPIFNETLIGKDKEIAVQKTIKDRNPSHYFRPYPDYGIIHKAVFDAEKVNPAKDLLLKNGSFFKHPLIINNKKYLILNTCSFDAISEVLTISAIDSEKYLQHIQENHHDFFGFILVLLDSGAESHVYLQRCYLLKNFKVDDSEKENLTPLLSQLPNDLINIIDVDTGLIKMWTFLIDNQPSLWESRTCECGHSKLYEVPALDTDWSIIRLGGFKELENAIRNPKRHIICPVTHCGRPTIVAKTIPNAHIFIDVDVREEKDLSVSITCKITDFPEDLLVCGQKYRLTGIIAYRPGHYYALCRRATRRWEVYDDLARKVTTFAKTKKIIPNGAIYIKVNE